MINVLFPDKIQGLPTRANYPSFGNCTFLNVGFNFIQLTLRCAPGPGEGKIF